MLKITINSDKLFKAFKKLPTDVEKELRIEMSKSLRTVISEARSNHNFQTKTGSVERSLKYEVAQDGLSGRVYIDETVAPHAVFLHEGTGLYGKKKKPYIIKPKDASVLHFVADGKNVFASKVIHPGIKKDPFLSEALKNRKTEIRANMRKAITRSLKSVGLK